MSSSEPRWRAPARSRPQQATARSRRRGFTLLEVLAAVALLGILYSLLARVAIEGLRAEGDSKRRLEAALIAEERLGDLIGAPAPPVGHHQETQGDFTLDYDVTAFTRPPEWNSEERDAPAPILLATTPGSGVQALRSIQITVSWLEGVSERHISRFTYLLDFQVVAALAGAAQTATPP